LADAGDRSVIDQRVVVPGAGGFHPPARSIRGQHCPSGSSSWSFRFPAGRQHHAALSRNRCRDTVQRRPSSAALFGSQAMRTHALCGHVSSSAIPDPRGPSCAVKRSASCGNPRGGLTNVGCNDELALASSVI
jgi:hypothetical protein